MGFIMDAWCFPINLLASSSSASEVEEEEKVDEKSVNLEDEIQDLAEELEATRFIGKHQASIMKPVLYNWFDSNGRQKVTIDFLVQSLPINLVASNS